MAGLEQMRERYDQDNLGLIFIFNPSWVRVSSQRSRQTSGQSDNPTPLVY